MTASIKDLPGRLLSKPEAAEYLGISVRTLDDLTKSGRLISVRPTPFNVKFTVADLDAYIASLRPVVAVAVGAVREVSHA